MNYSMLKRIVEGGEGQYVEFKRKADYPHKIVRELVAFANTKGGKLFLGVDDNLTIPGLKYPEEERYAMEEAIKKYILPTLNYDLIKIPVSEKRAVYVFDVKEGVEKPYVVKIIQNLYQPKAYIRYKDQSLQVSKEIWQILKKQKNKEGTRFSYGDNEEKLFKYLGKHKYISVKQYASEAEIPVWKASKSLVLLTSAKVLGVIPGEQEDKYYIKGETEESLYTQ